MKKLLSNILVCVLTVAILTICIVGNAPAKEEIIYMMWANTAGEAANIRKDLDVFEEAFPEIKVKFVYVPSPDYQTKLLTMIAGGVAPDVFVVFGAYLNDMYKRGVFEPLDQFIKNDPESGWGDFFVQDTCVFDGKIMVLPHFAGGYTLAYNEELFEQAGLSMPYDIYLKGKRKTWNWQTFIEIAKKLTKDIDGDGLPDQYGANPNLANIISFFITLRGFGEQEKPIFKRLLIEKLSLIFPANRGLFCFFHLLMCYFSFPFSKQKREIGILSFTFSRRILTIYSSIYRRYFRYFLCASKSSSTIAIISSAFNTAFAKGSSKAA